MITLIANIIINPADKEKIYYIGNDNDLIVKIGADMVQFAQYTMGKRLIMGHNTFKNVGPLYGRYIYVLTRKKNLEYIGNKNICFVDNINFKELSKLPYEIVVCGGSNVYEQSIEYANKLRLTLTTIYPTNEFIGNKFFPDFSKYGKWDIKNQNIDIKSLPQCNTNGIVIDNCSIIEYNRIV